MLYIIGALIIIGIFMIGLAIFSKTEDPEEKEQGRVRQMYPHPDDPEHAITSDNYPVWKQSQRN